MITQIHYLTFLKNSKGFSATITDSYLLQLQSFQGDIIESIGQPHLPYLKKRLLTITHKFTEPDSVVKTQ